jgi:uncharacterized protein (DUF2384 family)
MSYAMQHGMVHTSGASYWGTFGLSSPSDMVNIERQGVPGAMVKSLADMLSLTTVRFAQIIGAPKATLERKAANGTMITGSSAHAALGTAKLIGTVQAMLDDSTHPDAKKLDAAKWLGQWIEQPQPALGGQKPADMMDTPTGMAMVSRVLGAIASGAYL